MSPTRCHGGRDDPASVEAQTEADLKRMILVQRLSLDLSKENARGLWDQAERVTSSEGDFHDWLRHPKDEANLLDLDDYYGSYSRPLSVRNFMKRIWPAFIDRLKAELDAEAKIREITSALNETIGTAITQGEWK